MSLDFRKTVLLMSACTALGFSYSAEVFAVSPNQSVNAVQQSRKVTGQVADSQGPVIGATIMEKERAMGLSPIWTATSPLM